MAYVVTDQCVKDFLCVDMCVVEAIAPAPENPAAATVSQVFINPDACIECGSCMSVCENNAIHMPDELDHSQKHLIEKNRAFFQ